MSNHTLREQDDSILVSLYQKGNRDALGVLIERHSEKLSMVLFPLLKDPYLVEEIIQNTFLKIMKALQKGTYTEEGTFLGYLMRCARNLAMDYFRSQKVGLQAVTVAQSDLYNNENFSIQSVSHEPGPEEVVINMETDYDIESLLGELPEEQKQVVVLRIYQDFSFQEIADFTGESINTCLGRMRYALINLRKAIGETRSKGKRRLV